MSGPAGPRLTTARQGMADDAHYLRIRFPNRAENLPEFGGYKVFLDLWNPLATELRACYEDLVVRNDTKCLAVFGPQGSGKTMFARKLADDFKEAKADANRGPVQPDKNNLWHKMTGGSRLAEKLVSIATINTELLLIEDNADWVTTATTWKAHHPG